MKMPIVEPILCDGLIMAPNIHLQIFVQMSIFAKHIILENHLGLPMQ